MAKKKHEHTEKETVTIALPAPLETLHAVCETEVLLLLFIDDAVDAMKSKIYLFCISIYYPAFLVVTKQLYKSVCPTVRWSVRPSVMLLVTLSLFGLLGATDGVYTALFD